ncbi:5-methyltetrahydropteroyltriglutamate--homocysteine S-methyltransferase, partial [Pseudomonas syringae pv. tagetis]
AQLVEALAKTSEIQANRARSSRIHNPQQQARLASVTAADHQRRSAFPERIKVQRERLQLPPFTTTTIGKFPQTTAIRLAR